MANMAGKNLGNWQPDVPTKNINEKLMRPNAHDAKDTVTAVNELKTYVGKSGKPQGPLGKKGRGF